MPAENPFHVPHRDLGRFQRVADWTNQAADAYDRLKQMDLPPEAFDQIYRTFESIANLQYELHYRAGWREYPTPTLGYFDLNPSANRDIDRDLRELLDGEA